MSKKKNARRWSKVLHPIAAIAGILGVLAMVAAWIASFQGTFLGQEQLHWFNDAKTLLLVSIAFGIGTLIHLKEEGK